MNPRRKNILVTCTTPDRADVFERCRFYVSRFKEPHTHIVVNADRDYTKNLYSALLRLPEGWETLTFIEDDDWYGPHYLSKALAGLHKAHIFGHAPLRVYNPDVQRAGIVPMEAHGGVHSSLCSTAIRRDFYEQFLRIFEATGAKWLDMALWQYVRKHEEVDYVLHDTEQSVGLKGLTDNPCGYGHGDEDMPLKDSDGALLRQWLGEDAKFYEA